MLETDCTLCPSLAQHNKAARTWKRVMSCLPRAYLLAHGSLGNEAAEVTSRQSTRQSSIQNNLHTWNTNIAMDKADDTSPASPVSTAAILRKSIDMSQGAQKVEELSFDDFAGRSFTVEDLISGMSNMSFQASSLEKPYRLSMRKYENSRDVLTFTCLLCHERNESNLGSLDMF
jgi:hypothetical protein